MSRLRLPDEHLPDGPYRLRILHADAGRSRAGRPTVRVRFEVAGGVHAGRRVTISYSLLPQAVWRLRRLCAAAGVSLAGGDLDPGDLASAVIEAELRGCPTLDGPVLYDLEHERPAAYDAPRTDRRSRPLAPPRAPRRSAARARAGVSLRPSPAPVARPVRGPCS